MVRAKFKCTMLTSYFNTTNEGTKEERIDVVTTAQFAPVYGDGEFDQEQHHEMFQTNGGRISVQFVGTADPLKKGQTLRPAVHEEHAGEFEEGKEYYFDVTAVEEVAAESAAT